MMHTLLVALGKGSWCHLPEYSQNCSTLCSVLCVRNLSDMVMPLSSEVGEQQPPELPCEG